MLKSGDIFYIFSCGPSWIVVIASCEGCVEDIACCLDMGGRMGSLCGWQVVICCLEILIHQGPRQALSLPRKSNEGIGSSTQFP